MGGKALGYIISAVQIVAGVLLTVFSTGTLSNIGVSLIISGVLGLAATALAPSPADRDGFGRSRTYGFDRISNGAFEGDSRSFVVGKHRVAPAYLSAFTEQNGDAQRLKAVMYVSYGGEWGIEDISNIRINDQPISHFDDVTLHYRYGTSDQTAPDGFDKTGTPYEIGTTFIKESVPTSAPGDYTVVTYDTHKAVDELALVWLWSSGLFKTNDKGDMKRLDWEVQIEYSEDDGATWKYYGPPAKVYDGWDHTDKAAQGVWRVYEETRSAMRRVMRLYFNTRKERKIRITGRLANTKDHYTREATLLRIEELVKEDQNYEGDALLYIDAVASSQLSGGLPKITADVKGWKVIPIRWNGNTAVWSRNPADIMRAILVDPVVGGGKVVAALQQIPGDLLGRQECPDLDDAETDSSWYLAKLWYDGLVRQDNQQEVRCYLDLMVDSIAPITDYLGHILKTCQSAMIERDGKLYLLVDKASASVRTFDSRSNSTAQNVSPILRLDSGDADLREAAVDANETTSHVRVQYWDRNEEWERTWTKDLIASNYTSTKPTVVKELNMPGITRESQALRVGRYQLNIGVYGDRIIEWGVGPHDLDLLPFDVVTLYCDAPALDGVKVKILSAAINEDGTGRYSATPYTSTLYNVSDDPRTPKFKPTIGEAVYYRPGRIPQSATGLKVKTVVT